MSKRTPKNPKIWHNTHVVLCWHKEKNWNREEAMDIVSSRKVKRSLPKPSCLLWEALVCEKHIPKPAPNGTKFYHGMLMPLHDSMPSFMNFRRVLDLLEFKNQASQCFAGNQRCPGVWNSFPFLAWDLSMHPKDTYLIFQPIYMHWSMCM